tara:strand:+ start:665 stop:859 length:195 start_codon:yes stop_codon:yes gene_type:complete
MSLVDNPSVTAVEKYVEMLERKIQEQSREIEAFKKEIEELSEKVEGSLSLRELRVSWAKGEIEN